jgi:ABC-2 type transport system ATP-binding protein
LTKEVDEPGEDESVIETRGLRKEFPGLVAVESLDLKIAKGTLYGLIGPNGSGKTTAIKMLVGLLRPTGGQALVLGERVPLRINRTKIGYMPQENAVYGDLTIRENLKFFGGLYSVPKEPLTTRMDEVLKVVDLAARQDSLVSQLSGGMKHRVSLACTLMHEPEVVFLDEPTVGVDPELRFGFWRFFHDLRSRGKTIILTTHYMDEAIKCDRVGMMRAGRLIAEGSPRELIASTRTTGLEDAFLEFSRRP